MRKLIESTPSQNYHLTAAGITSTATITGPLIRQILQADADRGGVPIRGAASNAIEVLDPYVVFYIQPAGTSTDPSVFDNIQVELREQTFDVYGSANTFIAKANLTAQFVWGQGRLGFHLAHAAVSNPIIQVWNRRGAAITLTVRMEIYGSEVESRDSAAMRGSIHKMSAAIDAIGKNSQKV